MIEAWLDANLFFIISIIITINIIIAAAALLLLFTISLNIKNYISFMNPSKKKRLKKTL